MPDQTVYLQLLYYENLAKEVQPNWQTSSFAQSKDWPQLSSASSPCNHLSWVFFVFAAAACTLLLPQHINLLFLREDEKKLW